jgi:hypothetical protein
VSADYGRGDCSTRRQLAFALQKLLRLPARVTPFAGLALGFGDKKSQWSMSVTMLIEALKKSDRSAMKQAHAVLASFDPGSRNGLMARTGLQRHVHFFRVFS